MEGWILKKGWVGSWKMRYLKCSDEEIHVYKLKDDSSSKKSYPIPGCQVKLISDDQFEKPYVFSIKTDMVKLVLAAEDEDDYKQWIEYFKQWVKRPSFAPGSSIRYSNVSERSSVKSRNDIQTLAFDICRFVKTTDDAILNNGPQSQFAFAELAAEFISLLHSHIETCTQHHVQVESLNGITIIPIHPDERKKYNQKIKIFSHIMQKRIKGLYIPFMSIVDSSDGKIYFASIDLSKICSPKLSNKSKSIIKYMSLLWGIKDDELMSKIEFGEDKNKKLWVIDVPNMVFPELSDTKLKEFAKSIDDLRIMAYDSPTLVQAMKSKNIPVNSLPKLLKMSNIGANKALFKTEMVARACKSLFMNTVLKDSSNKSVLNFFNSVLGSENEKFWQSSLIPSIQQLFNIKITLKPTDLYMPTLFIALQYHLGVDFIDTIDIDFGKSQPLTAEHLVYIHIVPRHHIYEYCLAFKKNRESNVFQLLLQKSYSKAIKVLNNEASLLQSLFGEQNRYVSIKMALLTVAYFYNDDFSMAEKCSNAISSRKSTAAALSSFMKGDSTDESLKILDFTLGKSNWLQILLCLIASDVCISNDQGEKAMHYIDQAIETSKRILGDHHIFTQICGIKKSKILFEHKKCLDAIALLETTLSLIDSTNIDNKFLIAEANYLYSDILIAQRKFNEAYSYAVKAYNVRKLQPKERVAFESVQQIAIILDSLNNYEGASLFYQNVLNYLEKNEAQTDDSITLTQNILKLFFRENESKESIIGQAIKTNNSPSELIMVELVRKLRSCDVRSFAHSLLESASQSNSIANLSALYHYTFASPEEIVDLYYD